MALYRIEYTVTRKYAVLVEAKNLDAAEQIKTIINVSAKEVATPQEITEPVEKVYTCRKMIPHVHYLHNGFAMCGAGMPENFSIVRDGKVIGSTWSHNWDDVDCPRCLAK